MPRATKKRSIEKAEEEIKRAAEHEFVVRMQLEHKRATDLGGAIANYLRDSYDTSPLKAWYMADKSGAEYEMVSFSGGLHFSEEFDCLPDAVKYHLGLREYAAPYEQ